MAATVTDEWVIARRMRAHHLAGPAADLRTAAGACGIQDSPPGSALVSLAARVPGLTAADLDDAVDTRLLVRSWSIRGAPWLFPTADLGIFTTGVLAPTEGGRAETISGVRPALETLALSLDDAVALTRTALGPVLSGRRLPIGPLGVGIAADIAPRLDDERRARWEAPGPYAPGQPLGEAVVHFCLRILTMEGALCFAPRTGRTAPFVLLSEWLGRVPEPADPTTARAALLRRYLHCYGPSTPRDFAAWLGVRPADAAGWWDLLDGELTPVRRAPGDGMHCGEAWLLTEDVAAAAPSARGVRLLPPNDPYLQQRDRDTIADPAHHHAIWRAVGAPGALLVDGAVAGVWRPRKRGRRLTLTVTAFAEISSPYRAELEVAARRLAELRGAGAFDVVVSGSGTSIGV